MAGVVTAGPTDRTLVAAAQRGDRAAFEQLVVRHAESLHRVVRRLVANDHDAREVAQETFVRAWRGIGRFKGDAEFFTWLYRIGVNEAHRHQAAQARAQHATSIEMLAAEPRDPGPGPASAAEHQALRAALDEAIAALHPEYRAALVLRDIEGLSTQEIAQVLGLREAALKSRLHRARMQVRAAVTELL